MIHKSYTITRSCECINNFAITFDNTPQIEITSDKQIINVKSIVQQCYVAHDHISACKSDQTGMNQAVSAWNENNKNDIWPLTRNVLDNPISFCGVKWKCREHNQINCNRCLNRGLVNKGDIIYECVEDDYPYYKAFSIYQGYVNRLWNSKTITQLKW